MELSTMRKLSMRSRHLTQLTTTRQWRLTSARIPDDPGGQACFSTYFGSKHLQCDLCLHFMEKFSFVQLLANGTDIGGLDKLLKIADWGCPLAYFVYTNFMTDDVSPIAQRCVVSRNCLRG